MSRAEVDRLEVVQDVVARRLRQSDAARRLGVSVRQVKRLVRRYRALGRVRERYPDRPHLRP